MGSLWRMWHVGAACLALCFACSSLAMAQENGAENGGAAEEHAAPAADERPPPPALVPAKRNKLMGVQGLGGGGVANAWVEFQHSLAAFGEWRVYAHIFATALLAVLLAASVAYHPRSYGKAATLEEVEQPKIFLMYGLVGALVGQICRVDASFGLVIFGLGGLFRFRTDVGAAGDTGRLILVTLVGICCGYGMLVPAVLATVIGWFLIFSLEARTTLKLTLKGLDEAILATSATAYHEVLAENGCIVLSQKKNFLKKQVAFVFRAPKDFDRESLEELFKDIPPKLQGAPDWESS